MKSVWRNNSICIDNETAMLTNKIKNPCTLIVTYMILIKDQGQKIPRPKRGLKSPGPGCQASNLEAAMPMEPQRPSRQKQTPVRYGDEEVAGKSSRRRISVSTTTKTPKRRATVTSPSQGTGTSNYVSVIPTKVILSLTLWIF